MMICTNLSPSRPLHFPILTFPFNLIISGTKYKKGRPTISWSEWIPSERTSRKGDHCDRVSHKLVRDETLSQTEREIIDPSNSTCHSFCPPLSTAEKSMSTLVRRKITTSRGPSLSGAARVRVSLLPASLPLLDIIFPFTLEKLSPKKGGKSDHDLNLQ